MLKLKTHSWFFITAILILIIGTFRHIADSDRFFDINIHDTYYVIDQMHIAVLLIVLYWIAGTIYWVLRNFRLVRLITLIHITISVVGVVLFWILWPLLSYIDRINFSDYANAAAILIPAVVLIAQVLFIINCLTGLLRWKR